jgi:hypothetical protein
MAATFRFLASYEGLIYLVLALGGMITLRWAWRAWREWREALFGLEREFALRRLGKALSASLLILFFLFGEFIIASFIVPILPASVFVPTATLDLLSTPAATLSPDLATALAMTPLAMTSVAGGGCIPNQLNLTFPRSGQEVSGVIELKGTIDIPNFGFYKYEVASQGSDSWATISAGRDIIHDGILGLWDTTEMTPGDYLLRLVAIDNQGQSIAPCIIPVRVKGQ